MATAYRLCISQLVDDGYVGVAQAVSAATGTPGLASLPHRPLTSILATGNVPDSLRPQKPYAARATVAVGGMPVARFSADGRSLAVGTSDGAVGIFDAEGLLSRSSATAAAATEPLRRYADHAMGVNDVDFHPTTPFIVSGSEDATMHFYDTASAHAGPSRTCTDTHPVKACAFHPRGDHLLVGTTHAALHLYDMATFRCYLAADAAHHHRAALTDARWSADGRLIASCAASEVKVWDGVGLACVATLGRPHGGTPVGSVSVSKRGTYLLTAGADSAVKLWDVRMLREAAKNAGAAAPVPLRTYEGGGMAACFTHDDRHVVGAGADAASGAVMVWLTGVDAEAAAEAPALGGELVSKCTGHSAVVRKVIAQPNAAAFASCSDDGTVRAWGQ